MGLRESQTGCQIVRLSSAMVVLILLTFAIGLLEGVPVAYAESSESCDSESAAEAAAVLLQSMSGKDGFENAFDFQNVDFDSLQLGCGVQLSQSGGSLKDDIEIWRWPVCDDLAPIAYIFELKGVQSESTYVLSSLPEPGFVEQSGNNEDEEIAKIMADSSCDSHNNPPVLLDDSYVDIPYDENWLRRDGAEQFYCAGPERQGSIRPLALNTLVWVPRIKQPDSVTCWAACASSVGEYLTGTKITPATISTRIFGGSSSGTAASIATALGFYTYPSSATKLHGYTVPNGLSDQEVRSWLSNGMPICAIFRGASGAHAVVVCGWSRDSNNRQTLTVMDPDKGIYLEVMKGDLGLPTLTAGYVWNYQSVLLTQWQKPKGESRWTYMLSDGTRARGWKQVGSSWYWFDSSGYMATGWKKISGKWYWMNSSGAAVTGWKQIGGYWYAFDTSCAMRTGWFKDGSYWYYLRTATNTPAPGPEGAMLANGTWTIGGKAYKFNASGACLNP